MEAKDRISTAFDVGRRHERAIWYLLRRAMDLTARYGNLQNRSRWNNLRIYQVLEDSEGPDVKVFVQKLIQLVPQPLPEGSLQIERAHRSSQTNKSLCCTSIISC